MSDRSKWDTRYRLQSTESTAPCQLLREYSHLLPPQGNALDLAAGLGGNAFFLALHGLSTQAWDISGVAMQVLQKQADIAQLPLQCQVRDVIAEPPSPASFDLIVVSRFLHRPLCPAISRALRPGGLLFYQTFTATKCDPAIGPSNPDYLLGRNELLQLFPDLSVILYREEGCIGNIQAGMRNEAWLIAMQEGNTGL